MKNKLINNDKIIKIKNKRKTYYTDFNVVYIKDKLMCFDYNDFLNDFILPFGFIYKITNIINNKIYIGQTIQSPFDRFNAHISVAYKSKKSNKFQLAIKKYGKNAFDLEVIKDCKNQKELNKFEKYYIKLFNSIKNGYNTAEGNIYEENIMKGKSLYILWKNKYGDEMADKLLNEFKEKQRVIGKRSFKDKNLTFKGQHHSEECKLKMSKIRLGSNNPMYGKNPYNIWIEKYGIEEANKRQKSCLLKRQETRNKNKKHETISN